MCRQRMEPALLLGIVVASCRRLMNQNIARQPIALRRLHEPQRRYRSSTAEHGKDASRSVLAKRRVRRYIDDGCGQDDSYGVQVARATQVWRDNGINREERCVKFLPILIVEWRVSCRALADSSRESPD